MRKVLANPLAWEGVLLFSNVLSAGLLFQLSPCPPQERFEPKIRANVVMGFTVSDSLPPALNRLVVYTVVNRVWHSAIWNCAILEHKRSDVPQNDFLAASRKTANSNSKRNVQKRTRIDVLKTFLLMQNKWVILLRTLLSVLALCRSDFG